MSDTASVAPHPLRIATYRHYLLARFASTIALAGLTLIIGWQMYHLARLTMSVKEATFLLGMIGVAQFVPLFLLTPVTGLVADTVDRRWVTRATTALMLLVAVGLAAATLTDRISIPLLFAAAAAMGIARAFSGPAFSALAPNLVPREQLPTAIALSSTVWQVGTIAGPSLGGVLYAAHHSLTYTVSAVLYVIALGLLFLIPKVPQPPAQTDQRPLERMREGFRYVRTNRLVFASITLDLFAVLLAGATALLPVFARDILQTDSAGLGILAASMGVGAAIVALLFAWRPMRHDVGTKMLAAVGVFGVAVIVFGLSRSFWLSAAALAVAGAADMVSVYVRSSLIQLHTPDAMRGRVSAVSQLTISASNELGEAESGLLGSVLGPVAAVVVGGVGAILVTALWAWRYPELRLAKSFDPPDMTRAD